MSRTNTTIDHILSSLKIESLNDMQKAAIEAFDKHDDLLLLSATGSGKTLAYLIPLLRSLKPDTNGTQALIIVPSRELAIQIESVFKAMITGYKITCCYGGHARETEENNLRQPPALLVGTPGRLSDHIRRGNVTTDSIRMLVLDEFDKSLELGFHEEMNMVLDSLRHIRKRIFTSATEAIGIPSFIEIKDLIKLDFLSGEIKPGLAVKKVLSDQKDKLETLYRLLCHLGNEPTIVFCNHRESVERTSAFLSEKEIINAAYHGALEQNQRDTALFKFRSGSVNVLVTTDLASRGLDIAGISYIIHYHLPDNETTYTHRNGRTARMEASGTSILILSPEEQLPGYIQGEVEEIKLAQSAPLPLPPVWTTLFVAAGKKDKINKIDIVGFLGNIGKLKKEDMGLIEVKDFFSFVAIKKARVSETLRLVKEQKIKNQKVKIAIAK